MSAAALINRLDGVRATGPGRWIAKCPAHDDRSPSLSVRELDDGRLLVHCFGGCDIDSVLSTLSLEFAALFPPPDPRVQQRPGTRRPWSAAQMLALAEREIRVAAIIISDVAQAGTATPENLQRLTQAGGRLAVLVDAL